MLLRLIIAIAALLLLPASGFSQHDKADILACIAGVEKALVAKDSAALDRLLHNEFIGSSPRGDLMKKDQYISFHCRAGIGLQSIEEITPDNIVRIYGNMAVVNRKVRTRNVFPDGSTAQLEVRRTEVCLKQNGKWVLINGQGTHINPDWRPK